MSLVFIPGARRRRRVEVTDARVTYVAPGTRDNGRDWKMLKQEPPVAHTAGKSWVIRYVRFGDGRTATEVLARDGYWYEIKGTAVVPDVCLLSTEVIA